MVASRLTNQPDANTTHRESGTLMRGPAFAAVARDLGSGLRHLLTQQTPSDSPPELAHAGELRWLVEEAENMAQAFDSWEVEAPVASQRIELVERLVRLRQRISAAYR